MLSILAGLYFVIGDLCVFFARKLSFLNWYFEI